MELKTIPKNTHFMFTIGMYSDTEYYSVKTLTDLPIGEIKAAIEDGNRLEDFIENNYPNWPFVCHFNYYSAMFYLERRGFISLNTTRKETIEVPLKSYVDDIRIYKKKDYSMDELYKALEQFSKYVEEGTNCERTTI